jgi:hypothetical protein
MSNAAGSFEVTVYASCTALGSENCNGLKLYRMGCWLKEVQAPLGPYEVHIDVNTAFVPLKAHEHFVKATSIGQTPLHGCLMQLFHL